MTLLRSTLLAFTAAAFSLSVWAQPAYPSKPVKVVVGYAAGGAVDVVARTIGQSLQTSLGQPFVVENKPGAGTNIAVKSVIAAEPDGHTLMMAANALAANMSLYKPQPFDAEKELVAISLIGRVPVVIAANPNVPYANIQQLIAAAKGKPNSIAYGSPGNGSTPHMAIELFARAAGIDLQHIPYRGGSPAITDTIGGQVPLVAVNALEVLPHARSGKLKVLAVLSPNRSANFPEVPTIAESGYPGFEASVWYGLVAPARTPDDLIKRVHAAAVKVLAQPDVRSKLLLQTAVPIGNTPDEFRKQIVAERDKMIDLVKRQGIKLEQ